MKSETQRKAVSQTRKKHEVRNKKSMKSETKRKAWSQKQKGKKT